MGNQDAFKALMEKYRLRLESMIHLKLGSQLRQRVEVDDVVQEAYLMAFRSIKDFQWQEGCSFFQWLRGITENVLRNLSRYHFRTKKREAFRDVSLSEKSPGTGGDSTEIGSLLLSKEITPSKILRRQERFHRLEGALKSLSRDHRRVIILARVEGLPMKEIARQMNRSVDAASMLLLRALRQLRAYFGSTDSLHLPSFKLELDSKEISSSDERKKENNEMNDSSMKDGDMT